MAGQFIGQRKAFKLIFNEVLGKVQRAIFEPEKCMRSPKDPRYSLRETLIQTCSYGKCHAGGGSG
jgi:hypothetical protein